MINKINPTSKVSTKMQCLMLCNGEIEKAEKLYAFLVSDLETLPDFDVVPPSKLIQLKDTANGIFGWVKENKDDIFSLIDFVKSLRKPTPTSNGTPLPPL